MNRKTALLLVAIMAGLLTVIGCVLRRRRLLPREAMMTEEPMMEESRLETVMERGTVVCASRDDVPGYGSLDADGNNVGFDIDLCRALAAAVLGDPNAIEIRLITAAQRGPTVQSGERGHAGPNGHLGPRPATHSGATTPRPCSTTVRASWSGRTWVSIALWT